MEIHNAHPAVNGYGAPGKPSVEEMWDLVLSAGRVIFWNRNRRFPHLPRLHTRRI